MKCKITWWKSEFFLIITFLVLYFIVRAANLTSIPVYLDEAIYINWAHLFSLDKNLAYVSMQDGKTPLFFWCVSYFLKFWQNPLFSARIVSVIAGAGTMLASWLMTRVAFGKNTAIFTLPLYILIPYAQLVERMAFADSLQVFLGTLSIALVFIIIKVAKENHYWPGFLGAVFIGIILGLTYLTKSSAKIYLIYCIGILVGNSIISIKIPKRFSCSLIFGGIIWMFYSEIITAFRTGASRFYLNIATKEELLTFSLGKIIKNPFNAVYKTNFPVFIDYLFPYLGIVFIGIVIFASINILKRKSYAAVMLLLITATTGIGIFLTAKSMASRYFLPLIPLIVSLGAYGLKEIFVKLANNRRVLMVIVLMLVVPWILFDRSIIYSPASARLSEDDRNYLFKGELSGVGIEEVVDHLLVELQDSDVTLAVDSFWGQPDYIELKINRKKPTHHFTLIKYPYFSSTFIIDNSQPTYSEEYCLKKYGEIIVGDNETKNSCVVAIPEEIMKIGVGQKAYLLSLTSRDNQQLFAENTNLTLVDKYPRLPTGQSQLAVYFYKFVK